MTEKLRVTCCSAIVSDKTLRELTNILQGPTAATLDGNLVLLFDNIDQTGEWEKRFNNVVFPNECVFLIGREEDSLRKKDPLFRVPETLYHLLLYIGEGKCYYDGQWKTNHTNQTNTTWILENIQKIA